MTESEFRHRIRQIITNRLEEWFDMVPYIEHLCNEDLIPIELESILNWMLEKERKKMKKS